MSNIAPLKKSNRKIISEMRHEDPLVRAAFSLLNEGRITYTEMLEYLVIALVEVKSGLESQLLLEAMHREHV